MSISRGCSIASATASGVISWKTTRRTGFAVGIRRLDQVPGDRLALAVGVGRQDRLAGRLDALLRSLTVFDFVARDHVLRREVVLDLDTQACSSADHGHAPSRPDRVAAARYLPIVRAFAGDSTITGFFPLDFTVVAVDRDEGRLLLAALERDFVAGFVELLVAFGAVLPRGVDSSGIVSLGAATVAAGWIASCQAGEI